MSAPSNQSSAGKKFNQLSRFSLGPKGDLLTEDIWESLEGLLKLTWNIWGVSPLYGFELDELRLKQYSKKLREEVASILPHENVTYQAKFAVMDDVTSRPRACDPLPIKIEVLAKKTENVEKNIYTGIFMSWRTILLESSFQNSLKLPLLLCRGTKSAMTAVHKVISQMFDCQFVPLSATEDELEWLLPIMLDQTDSDERLEDGEIRLEYRIPELPPSDTITVKFKYSILMKLWMTLCENRRDENETQYFIKADRVLKFHEIIKHQMLNAAGLELGLCVLHKITMPSFTIMENRIKARTADTMHRFLLFYNDRSLKSLHTLDYDTTGFLDTFQTNHEQSL